MRKVIGLILLIGCMVTSAYADWPRLVVSLYQNGGGNSFQVASIIEWNRDECDKSGDEAVENVESFCSSSTAYDVSRDVMLGDKTITVKFTFPNQEGGRGLNDSTRVELSLYEGDKELFQSVNFGQHTEDYTTMPESGLKFRPQSLSLSLLEGTIKLKVFGVYGEADYENGVEFEKGLSFDFSVKDTINDTLLNALATTVRQP